MARISQAVAQVNVSGAASRVRIYFPLDLGTTASANNVDAKFGPQPQSGVSTTGSGGSSATPVYGGASCIEYLASLVNDVQNVKASRKTSWLTERSGGTLTDEYSCFSLRATLAWDVLPANAASDIGLFIVCGNLNNHIISGPNAGVVFGPTSAATVGLRAYKAALTVNEVVAAGSTPDLTKWNTFEIRCISGSPSADPVLFGLINGQVVTAEYSWTAAAALLPPPNIYAQTGYFMGVGIANSATQANVIHQYIREVCWTWAGSESALT